MMIQNNALFDGSYMRHEMNKTPSKKHNMRTYRINKNLSYYYD